MSEKLKVELQDSEGNVYYLHTDSSVVFREDGTPIEDSITALEENIKSLNSKTENGDVNETTYFNYKKTGQFIILDVEIINNFILEGRERYLLGTLPDGYRPCNKTVTKMTTYDDNNFAMQINTNGEIYIINMTPNPQETTSLWGHAVFSLI